MLINIIKFLMIGCILFPVIGCSSSDTTTHNDNPESSHLFIKGASMVAPVKRIDETHIQPIVNLNANSISLMPYAFFTVEKPEVRYNQYGQHWGENIDGVIECIQLAHKEKISVMLKPHLWIGRGNYTGAFTLQTEKDWGIWEDSYKRYILHFATVADSMNAELFCIGTELGATIKARPRFWSLLIDTLRQAYKGKLTYAANWDDYQDFPFWEKLDYIGVDAYFPLSGDKTPTLNSLRKGWKKHFDELEKISVRYNRPILFTEYGYRNVDYTAKEPWTENAGDRNDKAQSNALEALFQIFATKKWFAGGYVWKWYVGEYRDRNEKIDFTPQNKLAEKMIKNWYAK